MTQVTPRGTHFNHAPNDADLFARWLAHTEPLEPLIEPPHPPPAASRKRRRASRRRRRPTA
ncbi:MAG: hypothetical protein V9G19_05535 [Tetrasphaera sp.]